MFFLEIIVGTIIYMGIYTISNKLSDRLQDSKWKPICLYWAGVLACTIDLLFLVLVSHG